MTIHCPIRAFGNSPWFFGESWDLLALAFLTGLLVKTVDLIEDDGLSLFPGASSILGGLYGVLIAYTISSSTTIAPLWLATTLAMIAYGRVDAPGHYAGLIGFFFVLLVSEIADFSLSLTVLFFLVNLLEEYLNDLVDHQRVKLPAIFRHRPLLEIVALGVAGMTGQWLLFGAIFFFDVGYFLSRYLGYKWLQNHR